MNSVDKRECANCSEGQTNKKTHHEWACFRKESNNLEAKNQNKEQEPDKGVFIGCHKASAQEESSGANEKKPLMFFYWR